MGNFGNSTLKGLLDNYYVFLVYHHALPREGHVLLTLPFFLFCLLSPELCPDHQQHFIGGKPGQVGGSSAGRNLQHLLCNKSSLLHRLKPWQGGVYNGLHGSSWPTHWSRHWLHSVQHESVSCCHRPGNISTHHCCFPWIIFYNEREKLLGYGQLWSASELTTSAGVIINQLICATGCLGDLRSQCQAE